jgi:FSR family fosmidomycin resistance protein-like MFS transporter
MPERSAGGAENRRGVAALALGHGVNDLYMGFLPGLLPLLVDRLRLSYGAAGLLVTVVTTTSHLTQPLLGYGADRAGRRLFVVIGPVVTAAAMSGLGLVHSYEALLIVLLVGSLGNALFHPVGASLTGSVSRRSGTAMAVFSAGGNIGYGLGPVVAVAVVEWFGLPRIWLTVVVGLAAALIMLSALPRALDRRETAAPAPAGQARLHWVGPLLVLFVVVVLRAAEATVFTTFAPLLFVRRGAALILGGYVVLGFSLAGAAGGVIAGPLSGRLGKRWTTVLSLALAAVAWYPFLHTRGPLSAVLLLLLGAGVFAALPINIVMAQELLPRHASTASGLVMGLAWGVGSAATTAVGALADRLTPALGAAVALERAMGLSALLLVTAAVVALFLPETSRPSLPAPEPIGEREAVA